MEQGRGSQPLNRPAASVVSRQRLEQRSQGPGVPCGLTTGAGRLRRGAQPRPCPPPPATRACKGRTHAHIHKCAHTCRTHAHTHTLPGRFGPASASLANGSQTASTLRACSGFPPGLSCPLLAHWRLPSSCLCCKGGFCRQPRLEPQWWAEVEEAGGQRGWAGKSLSLYQGWGTSGPRAG